MVTVDEHKVKRSNHWFEKNTQGIWERNLLPFWKEREGIEYLELGVCEGASMMWILDNLDIKIAMGVDHYQPPREKQAEAFQDYEKNARHNLAPWIDGGVLSVQKENTFEWLVDSIHSMNMQPDSQKD